MTVKKKWGLGTAITGAVFIVVGLFAFTGTDVGMVGQVIGIVGLVMGAIGLRFVYPGDPPE